MTLGHPVEKRADLSAVAWITCYKIRRTCAGAFWVNGHGQSTDGFGCGGGVQPSGFWGPRSFVTDGLGSTLALTDSTGMVQTQYTYEPFGRTTSSGAASNNSYLYTGRENDGTGLYYYRARYYNPQIGRFMSEDPGGFIGGIDFYAYVENNPVTRADPFGLDWVYSQSTGQMTHIDKTGIATPAGTGYAGHNAGLKGLNDPDYEDVPGGPSNSDAVRHVPKSAVSVTM